MGRKLRLERIDAATVKKAKGNNLAKQKLSAGDLASMIRDRLHDPSSKITVYRTVGGSGRWHAVVYSPGHTSNRSARRVREIADELGLVYDLK